MNLNHKLLIFVIYLGFCNSIYSQNNKVVSDTTHSLTAITYQGPKKWIIAYQPGKAETINGIALGIIGQDVICNSPYNQTTNGLNIQIGAGLVHWKKIPLAYTFPSSKDLIEPKSITNGLQLSLFGTQTDVVNGVSISGFVSVGERINGMAINFGCSYYEQLHGLSVSFRNNSIQTKGIQIGIINKSERMSGLQIGLWNTVGKRSFPILNFGR